MTATSVRTGVSVSETRDLYHIIVIPIVPVPWGVVWRGSKERCGGRAKVLLPVGEAGHKHVGAVSQNISSSLYPALEGNKDG